MTGDLTSAEQRLMWRLFASGGAALQKDIKPKLKKEHAKLKKRGYLKVTPQKPTQRLELEERGWRWIEDCDPFPIGENEKRVTSERHLLRGLIQAMQRYAGAHQTTLAALFKAEPKRPDGLAEEIRSAFFALAGRPPREGVRLSALRAKLGEVKRADLDATLLAMRQGGQANLTNLDNPRDIDAERDAELRSGHQVFHILWIEA